jgi:hypothetical protein
MHCAAAGRPKADLKPRLALACCVYSSFQQRSKIETEPLGDLELKKGVNGSWLTALISRKSEESTKKDRHAFSLGWWWWWCVVSTRRRGDGLSKHSILAVAS